MLHNADQLWEQFFTHYSLSPLQQKQFKEYHALLIATNKLHNLTAITDFQTVLSHHFTDSLALDPFIDWACIKGFADIGTGAGFPALPLKIMHPEIPVVLIEVNEKKGTFLERLVEQLELDLVTLSALDWRTFLRKTDFEIDLFTARASLKPEELIRLFAPSSPYKGSQLVYWASKAWTPSSLVARYIKERHEYQAGDTPRSLILFQDASSALQKNPTSL